MNTVATQGIVIVCKAASHAPRVVIIRRFTVIQPEGWEEVEARTRRDAQRAEAAFEDPDPNVLRDMPVIPTIPASGQDLADDQPRTFQVGGRTDFRRRYRLHCEVCGLTVEARAEKLFAKLDKLRHLLPETGLLTVPLNSLAATLS